MNFPTSISERGDRVVATVSSEDNCERHCNQWLVFREVNADKVALLDIPLMDDELSTKLGKASCVRGTWSTCPHIQELEYRIEAANTVLARERWRQIPCYHDGRKLVRVGPGCEGFSELEVKFQDPRIIVSQQGRILFNRSVRPWIYRDASCKNAAMTDIESYALDPETGTLVIGLYYWAGFEGCRVPRWDFNPIRIPALRRKASPHRDGGAP